MKVKEKIGCKFLIGKAGALHLRRRRRSLRRAGEFKIFETVRDNTIYRIEEDHPLVGAYLYVFKEGKCIEDYLQNNVEECKLFALEEYCIEIDSWKIIDN